MICVKCGGQSVFPAMNEAPDGARDWRKCMSCGMRWDPTKDVLDAVKRAFEEWQPDEETERVNVHGEDDATDREIALDDDAELDTLDDLDEPVVTPLDLAMKDVLVKRGPKKKEKDAMPKFMSEEHRQRWMAGQELARKLKREAAGGGHGDTAKRKRGRPKKTPDAVVSVPARREPETLAYTLPVTRIDEGVSMLDAAISQRHAEIQILEQARELLSRE